MELKGSVLNWFKSYLTERYFSVRIGNFTTSASHLEFRLPQGSILAPLLFSLYMLPLGSILRRHGVSFHFYDDNTQIYLPIKRNDSSAIQSLFACLDEVKHWLASNLLTLNDSKTEVIVFGPSDNFKFNNLTLDSLSVFKLKCVRNLGVLFDSRFTLDKHVSSVVASGFFQLRLLSKIKHFLPEKPLETAVHMFVTARLDYCNSLWHLKVSGRSFTVGPKGSSQIS